MITELKPYSTYNSSGVEWLGDVPTHWKVKRPKVLFCKMTRPARASDEIVTCFRDGVVTLRKNRRLLGFTESLQEVGYQGVRKGDLVIHGMDAFAGSIGVSDADGKSTPVYSVCVPIGKHVNPYYYAYCVRDMARTGWIAALAKGIRERSTDFRFDVFGAQVIPFPTPREQTAIARFLDHTTSQIDRYIRAKQKLISLLEEQKQAIIHQAVTGQIDVRTGQPYPNYKPSGVEWFGEVPEHWKLIPNRFFLQRQKAVVGEKHAEFQLLSLTKSGVIIRDISTGRGKFSADMGTFQEVRVGDLILCLFDVPETPRTVGLSPHNGMITGSYTVFKCCDVVLRGYIEKLYIAMDNRKLLSPLYSGLRNTIPESKFLAIKSPVPPADEQSQILRYLDTTEKHCTMIVARTGYEIRLLREYRTRLIADVVTGKLDVREAAAKLPQMNPNSHGDEVDSILSEQYSLTTRNDNTQEAKQ